MSESISKLPLKRTWERLGKPAGTADSSSSSVEASRSRSAPVTRSVGSGSPAPAPSASGGLAIDLPQASQRPLRRLFASPAWSRKPDRSVSASSSSEAKRVVV
ncbi:hypothetical protein [Tuwongella immobilis]|uniref:Uncharacterized protein n=1 Tax=Tuwongella immobilis TaxID=692036 RepID=A0A6C2YJ59_9BACT|nr:hypothetical protein [Tuwongella immobilis]VIP01437.1 unnamed protein product [Tuwongella immobilis]VTR98403.1 unnamed protein product [Tuwongella immobilis]